MCTSGALAGRYLFKNRDMGPLAGLEETIVNGHGIYRYVGVAGHATPNERGLNSGINEKGIAAQMTYVGTGELEKNIDSSIPRGVLIESILRSAGSLQEAIDIAAGFLSRHKFVGGNITINSPQGAAIIEETYPRFAVEIVENGWIVRTNHFENLSFNEKEYPHIDNSKIRNKRFHELLEGIEEDKTYVEDIRNALSDHENGADAICRHKEISNGVLTVSTAIYDIRNQKLFYTYGNPCNTQLKEYAL